MNIRKLLLPSVTIGLGALYFFAQEARSAPCVVTPAPATPAEWSEHACSASGCAPSALPTPAPSGTPSPLPAGTVFSNLVNPMANCCGMGWAENPNAAQKLDCVEAAPATPGPGVPPTAFETFYSAGSVSDSIKTANISYPNELFLLDQNGKPMNGFYTQEGKRCNLSVPLDGKAQLTLIRQALQFSAPPTTPPIWTASGAAWSPAPAATVASNCCILVTFALERRCPVNDTAGAGVVIVARTDGATGVRRCTAADEMKAHYGVIDLCNADVVKRGRFRTATSLGSVDPTLTTRTPASPVVISELIREFYPVATPNPSPIPFPTASPTPNPPRCPLTPALIEIPWTDGRCDLVTP